MISNEKNRTGYPSIDKPWLKYYNQEITSKELPPQKIYDYIAEVARSHLDSCCLEYFGRKITYKAFLENVEEVAKAFLTFNVQAGDIVSVIAPTTPESIYCIYALNRIGAAANLIDPRLSIENLTEKTECSDLIVSINLVNGKVDKAVKGCKTVIYFSVDESFPMLPSLAYKMKSLGKISKKTGTVSWKDFLKRGKNVSRIMDTPYKKDVTAVVVSTSGTTGKSKLACITNENMNVVAYQYAVSGLISEQKFGDTFLDIMPIFLAYGVVSGVHMALAVGFKSVIIPQRELDKMGRYLLKYKPQYYLDTPGGVEALLNDRRIKKNTDLSFMKGLGVGGDHLNTKLEKDMNAFLKLHNAGISLCKGYGMTEISSCAVSNSFAECNTIGSVGIPFPKTLAKIVDTATNQEVKFDKIGELYLSSEAVFAGYINDDKATQEEIAIDEARVKWIKTGDLFSMNEQGELFFHGRLKTMIVRPDGHNNHPKIMSELILKHPAVREVCTVGVQSPYHIQGKYPKAVIVLETESQGSEKKVQRELERMCMEQFSQRDVPYFYEFLDELPYTSNGKVDYRKLEADGVKNSYMAEIAKMEFS